MIHYSCDLCKRPIDPQADARHVVKIEVFPAVEEPRPCGCRDADDAAEDADHLEEMQELLEQIDADDETALDDGTRSLRFDLCDACRQRFLKNPLGMKSGTHFDFSNN